MRPRESRKMTALTSMMGMEVSLDPMEIVGAIDADGRCAHWHSALDVVANKCATCGKWFACAWCHPADHAFGQMHLDEPAVMCGVCGHQMTFHEYGTECPSCGAPFNPGCKLHPELYFQVSD